MSISDDGRIALKMDGGRQVSVDPREHPHLDHSYAVTSHFSRGQTGNRVLIHIDTELAAKDLLNNRMAYVAVSRGAHDAQIFTSDREKLSQALSGDVSQGSAHTPEVKQVDELRRQREELPAPHLGRESAAKAIEKQAAAEIAQIEKERDKQVGILNKLIERARAFMAEIRAKKAAEAKESAERERRAAEAAAEAKREAEQLQKQEKQISERAEELWQRSPGGLAEQAARMRQADDKVREAACEENVRSAEENLAAWKKQSWVRSLLYENHDLQANVARAVENLAAHLRTAEAAPEKLAALAAQKEAAWPTLQRQAAEDVQEIGVRLQPEQARLLVCHVFPFDRAAAGAAWAQVHAGTHTLKVLDGLAEIENREPEGFVGYLQQRHKPLLDDTLSQLAQAQDRAAARERQREIERSRPRRDRDQDFGYGE